MLARGKSTMRAFAGATATSEGTRARQSFFRYKLSIVRSDPPRLFFFVLVVMAFRRVPALHAFAPTETEPRFQQTQFGVLVLFVLFGIIAVRRFRLNSRRRRHVRSH